MVVYGDLLFLINFSMDFLCFYISCAILHRKLFVFRAVAASVLGGIYSVLALFVQVDGALSLAVDIIALIIMCLIVFAWRGMGKAIFTYLFVSMLLGGIMTALFSLFNKLEVFMGGLQVGDGLDAWIFALLAFISCLFTLAGGRSFRSSAAKREAEIEICSELGVARLRALIDSGNLATEPISGKGIVFADIDMCCEIIDADSINLFLQSFDVAELSGGLSSRIRLVPARTVSEAALLPAVRFKRVSVIEKKARRELDVYVAFVKGGTMGAYGAIISGEAIN